ncbi:MAG: DUF5686 and carboxypeptidase regulatory-like domain-containing protein [Tannerella sp.]|jgi:hypothetical protein|nr:DUF5686 and carboxypeptidase regulatory-like domain-containing protein [Tannerella sp.]
MEYKKMNRLVLFCLSFTLLASNLQSQVKGVIVEKETDLTIPFASVIYEIAGNKYVVIADKKGEFSMPQNPVSLNISCVGFKPVTVNVENSHSIRIEMETDIMMLSEFVVTPKNNPALRIIHNALKNKDVNNYEKYDEYSYRCYMKTSMGVKLPSDSLYSDTTKKVDKKDSYFISESITLCRKSGGSTEDEIIATSTSGMKSPILAQLIYSVFHKEISVYNNSIPILAASDGSDDKLETEYLSPLGSGCMTSYRYQLENTFITEQDTVFEIRFFPRKSSNINGLAGTMYIHSNGYAVERIIAKSAASSLLNFRFKQDYKLTDGKWFPQNLDLEMLFRVSGSKKKSFNNLSYFITSVIDSVSYRLQEKKIATRLDKIFVSETDNKKGKAMIEEMRPVQLTNNELHAYHVVDSVMSKNNFLLDGMLNSLTKINKGKIELGKLDLDYPRLYSTNIFEDRRIGFGAHTNENLLPWFMVGGYFGYGTKDKLWKYGGDVEFVLNKAKELRLKISHQNSLKEVGRDMTNDLAFLTAYYRNIESYRFDRVIENRAELGCHILPSLKGNISFNSMKMKPLYDYLYKNETLGDVVSENIQVNLRWAVNEKYTAFGTNRITSERGNPIFNINYTRGIKTFNPNSLIYNKWVVSMSLNAYHGRIGESNIFMEGGLIDRPLPYGLMFTGEGSKNKLFSFYSQRTFQTMHPYEFLSDKYVNVFFMHNFGSLLWKTKSLSPEFKVAYNAGWGDIGNPEYHEIAFLNKNKIYQETGLFIDNIVKVKIQGLFYIKAALGAFYRIGYYHYETPKDNLAFKLQLGISFKK